MLLGALALAFVLGGLTWLVSDLPYHPPAIEGARLVVSFKHLGEVGEASRQLSPEELAELPVHMRPADGKAAGDRRRADVRLRVVVDGEVALEERYPPGGLWGDKASVALEALHLAPGRHQIEVAVGDTVDAEDWSHVERWEVELERGRQYVVLFERGKGFSWH